MNWLRNILLGGILVITFYLFIQWNEFSERNAELALSTPSSTASEVLSQDLPDGSVVIPDVGNPALEEDLPNVTDSASSSIDLPSVETRSYKTIEILTDSLKVTLDTHGGDILGIALPHHYAKIDTPDSPFVLLEKTESRTYIATTSLLGANGTLKKGKAKPVYTSAKTNYEMADGSDVLTVDLFLQQDDADIIKRFTFTRNSYLINVEYIVSNKGSKVWNAKLFGQIKRDNYIPEKKTSFAMASFTGYALTTPDTNYKRLKIKEIEKEKYTSEIANGWLAFVQHYFVSAWIPEKDQDVSYRIFKSGDLNVADFLVKQALVVEPGNTGTIGASFYSGPKNISVMQKLAPHLDKTIDYGWLWFIAKPLFYAMDNIHSVVGNWGIAIILLTMAIKLVFFYPSAMSYRSMAKMRKLTPMIQDLKERYGDDKQKIASEQMKLFKKEKVNPLGGCLPILMQMPVFIALYWMIMESVELRHSPFYLWIEDLSVMDPYFVLPLLMGASMYIQQKFNPTPPDPMQAKIMQMLPIFFTFLFLFFPAGLVLYWVVNNTLSIAQQYVITKNIEKAG